MQNNNGFLDAMEDMKTLLQVDETVTLDVLEEAANYFVEKLKPRIPRTNRNKKHLRDMVKVYIENDKVIVGFEDDGWYWYLVEHGHLTATPGKRLKRRKDTTRIARRGRGKKRVAGQHFVQNTWDAEANKIEEIMIDKIIKKMEG